MRTRRPGAVAATAALLVVLGLSACTAGTGGTGGTEAVVATDPVPASDPDRPDPRRQGPGTTPVTAEDRALAAAFTAYAVRPGARTAAAVPFAGEVRIGLGENLFDVLGRGDLVERTSWLLGLTAYGRSAPLDLLRPLRVGAGRTRVSVDQRPRCAGRGHRAPARFREARRVTLQPVRVASCLDWFALDLYVDRGGLVRGVTLELWEP